MMHTPLRLARAIQAPSRPAATGRPILLAVLLALQVVFLPAAALAQQAPSLEDTLHRTELPWRDLGDLAARMKGVPREGVGVATPQGGRKVGDRELFWVADDLNHAYFQVGATLRVVTPYTYMYVSDDVDVDLGKLREAARYFDDRIYAVVRGYMGKEPAIGVDGDPHISIVNTVAPGVAGYYSSADSYPRSVHPYSNERKALYISAGRERLLPGSAAYYEVLAHEFEHMIQWNTSKPEEGWVKEGAAEFATEAASLSVNLNLGPATRAFERMPDTQLNAWTENKSLVRAHYDAAYLFISYVLERYGGYQAGAELMTGETRGADTFDRFLAGRGLGLRFEDLFRDWVVANYLDETRVQDPRYHYGRLRVRVPATDVVTASVPWRERSVHQFAADYLEMSGRWSRAKVRFEGIEGARVIPPQARSGTSFWWSNRADLSDTRLTRLVDLRRVPSATLKFWTWYDLEGGYDYAYVTASRDGGLTWTTLPGRTTTTADPNGNNLGNGFTGKSGAPKEGEAQWIEESVDLTPVAGAEALVRFEAVTDDATNGPGFAVDDISIPELGYSMDAERDGGWFPYGFVRTDGRLDQRFSLQLIRFGDQITVEQVPLSAAGSAEIELDNSDGKLEKAVLVVSGLTRYTTEPARYRYSVDLTP